MKTTYQNLWDAVITVLKGEFTILNAYFHCGLRADIV